MELSEVIRTTFSAREFTADPVPDDVLYRILDQARFAPSGGNRQPWRVIVLRDEPVRQEFVELVRPGMQRYFAQSRLGESPWTVHPTKLDDDFLATTHVPDWILDPITKAPVLLVVCADLSLVASMDQDLDRIGVISGASIYPFCWSILLAARNEGLGGLITTYIAPREPEAQRLLGIPEHVAIAAFIPLGKPVKQLTKLTRKPVEQFTMQGKWGGEALQG